MKIFVSYSRADGGEFAEKISGYFRANSHDVFTDANNIKAGDPWSKVIEENISSSDIFVVVLTFAALRSGEIEKEVLLAQNEGKRIVPAKYKNIRFDEIPWSLNTNQGIEFESRDELVTRLYEKIFHVHPPQPNPKKSTRKMIWIVISIVIVSIILLVIPLPAVPLLVIIGIGVIIALILRFIYIRLRRRS